MTRLTLTDADAVVSHIVRRALAIEAMAPRLDAGMWYSDDLRDFARAQNAVVSPLASMPGRVPGDDFERLPRHLGLYALILRPRRSASRALRTFMAGPTVTECGNWLLALQYEAVLQAVGDAAFDRLFGNVDQAVPAAQRLRLSHPDYGPLQPLWQARDLSPTEAQDAVEVGDVVHFAGVPGYRVKHPMGVAGGWNLVCCERRAGVALFIGQGIGTPCTADAMAAQLVDAYNMPRTTAERALALLHPFAYGMRWRRLPGTVARTRRDPPCIKRMWRFVPQALRERVV